MIISMTGYGKAVSQIASKKITVEIRTLNSKGLDLNLRVPSLYREKELEIRQTVAAALSRGKVDASLYIEETGVSNNAVLNIPVLNAYVEQLKTANLSGGYRDVELLEMATRFPDVFSAEKQEPDEQELNTILNMVTECVAAVQDYRTTEGAVLEQEFNLRISNIEQLLHDVIEEDKLRLSNVRERLLKAVADLEQQVDQNRFEQELIYYLEKYDITEEKVRLKNHLNYFKETMSLPESQGRKLGFISQEIGREVNTIGSKSNHAAMQQLVVQMKDELEKIKEQLLNVL
jgi:uncharacterized protein (TIGR00255 family)